MFKTTQQRAAVCDRICIEARIPKRCWTSSGPTRYAEDVRSGKIGLSSGERLMVLAAWDIWNGTGKVCVHRLIDILDEHNLRVIGEAVQALANGSAAVDAWLRDRIAS